MSRIAVVDPTSRSLPYDFYFLKEISKTERIDFYCSKTNFNSQYIEQIGALENVEVITLNISNNSKILWILHYFKMLLSISRNDYKYIHFQWYVLFAMEFWFFIRNRYRLIITFHNAKPHSWNGTFYFPNFILAKIIFKAIFISGSVKREFIETYGQPKNVVLANILLFYSELLIFG